jgi:hypothetical protein
MTRGALISLIYKSMLGMKDGNDETSASLSLLSVDVDRICTSLQWVIGIAPDAIQVGIAIWLLEARLGAICVAPMLVVLGLLFSPSSLFNFARKLLTGSNIECLYSLYLCISVYRDVHQA